MEEKTFEEVFDLPKMTSAELFVIKGNDVYSILQLRRSPGVFFYQDEDSIIASVEPEQGYEIRFVFSGGLSKRVSVRIKGKAARKTLLSLRLDEFLAASEDRHP